MISFIAPFHPLYLKRDYFKTIAGSFIKSSISPFYILRGIFTPSHSILQGITKIYKKTRQYVFIVKILV